MCRPSICKKLRVRFKTKQLSTCHILNPNHPFGLKKAAQHFSNLSPILAESYGLAGLNEG